MNVKLKQYRFFFGNSNFFYFSSISVKTSYINKKVLLCRSFQQSRRYGRWASWRTFAGNLLIGRGTTRCKMQSSVIFQKQLVLKKQTLSVPLKQSISTCVTTQLLVLYLQQVLCVRQLVALVLVYKLLIKFF